MEQSPKTSTEGEPAFPELTKDDLVDLGGWDLLKEARGLVAAGAVREAAWEPPLLRGWVQPGNVPFRPRLDLTSLRFAENRCNCRAGRDGFICAHAIALCLQRMESAAEAREAAARAREEAERAVREAAAPALKSLVLSAAKGIPLRLALVLPPNLAVVAPRDAIMVKVETEMAGLRGSPEKLDRGRAYHLEPPHLAAAAKLEAWCGGSLGGLLQLRRDQLRELLSALSGEAAFFFANRPGDPLAWVDGEIPGVHGAVRALAAEAEAEAGAGVAAGVGAEVDPKADAGAGAPPSSPRPPPPGDERDVPAGVAGPRSTPMSVDGSTHFLAVTLPAREHPLYEEALDLLKSSGFRLEASTRKYWLRDRHRTLNFLARHRGELEERFGAVFTASFKDHTRQLHTAQVTVRAKPVRAGGGRDRRAGAGTGGRSGGGGGREAGGGGGGEFTLELDLQPGPASAEAVRRALATGKCYLEEGGAVYLYPPATVERLAEAQRALSGERDRPLAPDFRRRLGASELRDAEDVVAGLDPGFLPPEAWTARSAALKGVAHLQPPPLDDDLAGRLRLYQQVGAAWLWHLHRHGLGGVLADEMGLGKTVQALALVDCIRREQAPENAALVVCPASLVENWGREAARFLPGVETFLHRGRQRLAEPADFARYGLVVTSYGTLARDADLFRQVRFPCVVADEAQHVKNRRSQNARALRGLSSDGRFALTGTPLENSLEDLRSLFDFVLPGYLARAPGGARGEERDWFDARHRQQAAPYILRRDKRLVAPELPEKIEQVVYCQLGAAQRKLYKGVQEKTGRDIFEREMAGQGENQIRLAALAQLLRLRQVCAEPRLLDDALKPADSAKLAAFGEILDEALDGGHRILLFSSFVAVLQKLREALEERGLPFCYLDGQTPPAARLGICDRFNADPSIPVFLISLKAGGTGLNLTGADTVVHYDPWWNPAAEAQATDRAHRIGQDKVVTAIRLIAADTVEEQVLRLSQEKSTLLRDLLDESARANASVGLEQIKKLIAG